MIPYNSLSLVLSLSCAGWTTSSLRQTQWQSLLQSLSIGLSQLFYAKKPNARAIRHLVQHTRWAVQTARGGCATFDLCVRLCLCLCLCLWLCGVGVGVGGGGSSGISRGRRRWRFSSPPRSDDSHCCSPVTAATAVCVFWCLQTSFGHSVWAHHHYTGNVDITALTLAACATAEVAKLTAQLSAAAAAVVRAPKSEDAGAVIWQLLMHSCLSLYLCFWFIDPTRPRTLIWLLWLTPWGQIPPPVNLLTDWMPSTHKHTLLPVRAQQPKKASLSPSLDLL